MTQTLDTVAPPQAQLPLLLRIDQVAVILGFAVQTLRHWTCDTRRLPSGWPKPVRIGRSVRYRSADIVNWVNSGCQPTVERVTPVAEVLLPPKRGRGRPRKTFLGV